MSGPDSVWRLAAPPVFRTQDVEIGEVETELGSTTDVCSMCGLAGEPEPPLRRTIALKHDEPRGLGDFLWPAMGYGEVFVSPEVAAAVGGDRVELRRVAVVDRFIDRDTGRERGLLPNALREGLSTYSELVVTNVVSASLEQSTFVFPGGRPCYACGRFAVRWRPPGPGGKDVADVNGIEWMERTSTTVTPFGIDYELVRRAYRPGCGAAFRRSDVGMASVWRLRQYPYELLCSASFKRAIEKLCASNVDFFEVGRIIDEG